MSKVALVTGAANRLGAAIAENLHQSGWHVVIHYHQAEAEAENLAARLNGGRDGSVVALQADLRNVAMAQQLVRQAAERWGRLDALVNNAAVFYPTPLGQATEGQWHDLMDCNLKAAFFLSQAAAPWLRHAVGCIVNITDIYASRYKPDHAIYCLAKAGLVSLTEILALELAPQVRVNAIAPGAILWPEAGMNEQQQKQIMSDIPRGRQGMLGDITGAVEYLLQSDYVTGETIAVDGGRRLVI